MNNQKPKAIVFGASKAGRYFVKNNTQYNLLAIIDNDIKKHGSSINGLKVISPNQINEYQYDYIVITSIYIYQIQDQLVKDLQVDENKIIIPPKNLLKPSLLPFMDDYTLRFARESLFFILDQFEKNNIKHFIDFGALLGIVREGDFISWDDDIDIAIYASDFDKVAEILKNNIYKNSIDSSVQWEGFLAYNKSDDSAISIDLTIKDNQPIKKFSINISAIYFDEEHAITGVNHAPKHHFTQYEKINYFGKQIRVPYEYESYLEFTYGNWRQPKKDTSFADNTRTFREPVSTYTVPLEFVY
ncbi:LicD family protein [Desulfuribacillus alkaliarsenatis]|uniref:LicD/FKTN/FKRP nucleotidyltransferase domain-containing protein n=1 Tax=Desulfuribacillus alkaliarsenatis TaxID=766136 RepID=A0A1E5G3Q0_9FIRM|nr:LicD family protein [Desulfuribacillus alkaliarsenatis]OEF97718.1 hypothetical protein BHF68_14060 [Desulfuribacillus alkaliarsenatis]